MKYGVLFFALTMSAAAPAFSQCCGYGMSYDNVTIWPQPILHHAGEPEPKYKKPPLITAQPNIQANARTLSMNFPPAQRAEMEKAFILSMDVYTQVEKKMGWFPRDLAGALSAFVVGNYMVMKNTEVSDEAFDAVTRQFRAQDNLRDMLKNNPPEKVRDVFEQSAMIGAFMAMTQKSLKQHPQPPAVLKNLHNAAVENLKLVMRTDPGKLNIDITGIAQ